MKNLHVIYLQSSGYSYSNWYHFCESFFNSAHKFQNPNFSNLLFVAPEPRFIEELKPTTFFLFLLAFTTINTTTIEIIPPYEYIKTEGNLSMFKIPQKRFVVDLSEGDFQQGFSDAQKTYLSGSTLFLQNNVGCAKYEFKVNERGNDWYHGNDKGRRIRKRILDLCPQSITSLYTTKEKKKLVFYQRNNNRYIINADKIFGDLKQKLGDEWETHLYYHDDFALPCDLVRLLHDADVLLTPHGFQSTLLLFLPPGALLFEGFPLHYYAHLYETHSANYDLHYRRTKTNRQIVPTEFSVAGYSSKLCKKHYECRYAARQDFVEIDEKSFEILIETILELFPPGEIKKLNWIQP